MCIGQYLGSLFAPLVFVSVFMPELYYVDHYSFQLEIRQSDTYSFDLSTQNCFGSLGSLYLYMNFKIFFFFHYAGNHHCSFHRNLICCVDHFGQHRHFQNIVKSFFYICLDVCYYSRTKLCLTLQLHGLQDIRIPCPSSTSGACSNLYPSSQ